MSNANRERQLGHCPERFGLLCFSCTPTLEADGLHAPTAVFGKNKFASSMVNDMSKGFSTGEENLTLGEQIKRLRDKNVDPYLAFIGNVDARTLKIKPLHRGFFDGQE